jgi:hypothetical protein
VVAAAVLSGAADDLIRGAEPWIGDGVRLMPLAPERSWLVRVSESLAFRF